MDSSEDGLDVLFLQELLRGAVKAGAKGGDAGAKIREGPAHRSLCLSQRKPGAQVRRILQEFFWNHVCPQLCQGLQTSPLS